MKRTRSIERYISVSQLFKVIFTLLILLLFFSSGSYAQLSQGGTPVSFSPEKKGQLQEVPFIVMESIDVEALKAEDVYNDKIKDQPWRFGKDLYVALNPENSGVWDKLEDGSHLWRLGITSKNALSINMTFDNYRLPDGASLFICNAERTAVVGAFTSRNNQEDRYFAVAPIPGESVIIEYHEPADVAFPGELNLWRVTHGYRDINLYQKAFGSSGACNVNAICPEGDPIRDQIRSVAMIIMGGGLCSGALINNTGNNGAPLFLSADHCYSDPGSVVFRFNWQSATCSNPASSPDYVSLSGATQRARYSSSDFWLMELNQAPPPQYNVFYSGWNRTSASMIMGTVYGIHHPAGDIKKISWATGGVETSAYLGNAGSGTDHWRVSSWSDGTTTEGGSSGSPLYDPDYRIIGQLHGGYAACGNTDPDWYGKLAISWDGGGTSDSRLSDWLDPTATGATSLDGYDPNASASDGDDCSDPVNIFGITGYFSYTTTGLAHDYTGSCGGDGADKVFYLNTTVPDGGTLNIWTTDEDYNAVLYARIGSCTGTEIICTDDPGGAVASWENNTGNGVLVWIIADGANGEDGSAALNWTITTPIPAGDDCTHPDTIYGTSGTETYSTTGFSNAYFSACGGSSSDIVYYLDEPIPDGSGISFWTSGDNYDVVLYGRYGSCTGTEIGCVDDPDGTMITWSNNTGSDQYVWIIVDGYGGSTGTATLNWAIGDIPQFSGDNCSDPDTLTGTSGSQLYTNSGLMNDYSSACGGSSPDRVFYLDTPVPNGYSVEFWTTGENYDVVLYGRYGSCTGTEIACVDDPDGLHLTWVNSTGTDQYVWFFADGYGGSTGDATLNWIVEEAQIMEGDNCADPDTLTGLSGNIAYDLDGYNADYASFCGGSSADKVFYLTTPVPDGATLNFWTTGDNYDVVLYAWTDGCDGTEIDCVDDPDGTTLSWINDTGEDKYIWFVADGFGSSNGTAMLNWEIIPAELEGDDCNDPLNLTGNAGTESYSTAGFTNDYSGACGGSGPDEVFALTSPVPDGYMIDIWVSNSDYDVIFYAYTGGCGGDEIGCINDVDDTKLNWKNISGSDAYIWIVADGDAGGEGDANLIWEISEIPDFIPDNLSGYIEVYPNPVSEVLHVDVKHNGLVMENIALYDSQGKMILKENYDDQSNSHLEFNLSDLSEGFFMLEILTNKGLFTESIVIR